MFVRCLVTTCFLGTVWNLKLCLIWGIITWHCDLFIVLLALCKLCNSLFQFHPNWVQFPLTVDRSSMSDKKSNKLKANYIWKLGFDSQGIAFVLMMLELSLRGVGALISLLYFIPIWFPLVWSGTLDRRSNLLVNIFIKVKTFLACSKHKCLPLVNLRATNTRGMFTECTENFKS